MQEIRFKSPSRRDLFQNARNIALNQTAQAPKREVLAKKASQSNDGRSIGAPESSSKREAKSLKSAQIPSIKVVKPGDD